MEKSLRAKIITLGAAIRNVSNTKSLLTKRQRVMAVGKAMRDITDA